MQSKAELKKKHVKTTGYSYCKRFRYGNHEMKEGKQQQQQPAIASTRNGMQLWCQTTRTIKKAGLITEYRRKSKKTKKKKKGENGNENYSL